MGWALASLTGFAAMTVLIIVLARSNTSRWERDHRAAQAALRARAEQSVRARAAALMAQHVPDGVRRLPHPHVPHLHLPHIHLPARVVDRLPRPRGAVHRPHLTVRLPHLDGRLVRRLVHLPARRADTAPATEDDEHPAAT